MGKLQEKVYGAQDVILQFLSRVKTFPYVLSGGTALSRFYFHHRFSEDLDFFCEEVEYSFGRVEKIINCLRGEGLICELTGRTDTAGLLKVASYAVGTAPSIKVDFMEDPFSGMWTPVRRKTESGISFQVDTLDQIYYRKIFSLLEQWKRTQQIQRVKDLVDLHVLHHHHRTIDKTIELFRKEHVPVDEEKIILIFSNLKIKQLEESLKLLKCNFSANEIWKSLHQAVEQILKKGLRK